MHWVFYINIPFQTRVDDHNEAINKHCFYFSVSVFISDVASFPLSLDIRVIGGMSITR